MGFCIVRRHLLWPHDILADVIRSGIAVTAPLRKPKDVLHAELALWVWIAWVCLFGIWHEWSGIGETVQSVSEQTGGMVTIDPNDLLLMIVAGYLAIAALSAWFIVKLGQGRQWARSSVLWSLVLQAVVTPLPPFHPFVEYLGDIPDLGLQLFATILLYRPASSAWFEDKNTIKKAAKTAS